MNLICNNYEIAYLTAARLEETDEWRKYPQQVDAHLLPRFFVADAEQLHNLV